MPAGLQGRAWCWAPSQQRTSLTEERRKLSETAKILSQKTSLLFSGHSLVASNLQKIASVEHKMRPSSSLLLPLFPSLWFTHLKAPRASAPPSFSSKPGSFPYFSFSWNSFPTIIRPSSLLISLRLHAHGIFSYFIRVFNSTFTCIDRPRYITYFPQRIILSSPLIS